MKNRYQKAFSIAIALIVSSSVFAQGQAFNYWTPSSKSAVVHVDKVNRNAQPSTSQIFNLDINAFRAALINAPVRGIATAKSNLIMAFPTAEGQMENYRVMESPIMAPSLAASLPMIKTYVAQGIDDPTAYMRFSVTQFGLHTMSLSGNRSTAYIDPYTNDLSSYIIYSRASLGADPQPFECLTPQDENLPSLKGDKIPNNKAVDDQKFRTFRLAQTCTAEYGNIFATTVGNEFNDIMAQMVITINRVNSVYEIDLGLTLQFIANQSALVFWGSTGADPWSGEYNTATQNFLNTTLNDGDYDIGHNFNTSGGGNAGCIGCVCVNGQKGSGMTGRSNPTGDPFDIDYVAHEMGHQFGGYHTMNTCSRSGNNTEVEPASGSSVMSYAGICGTNVQNNSDAHFNYVNVRDISANIKTGVSTCAAITVTTNNPPTADAGNDYNIPKSTAFILEGTATDADGLGTLTYEWSQNDNAQAPNSGAPQSTWTNGPLYRAKMPIASPDRYMPRLQDVIAGNLTPTWEVTPSVGRTMNFSFMVRDNEINGAQTADDLMTVTVDGGSGPFAVTSQTTAVTWDEGTNETITWNVANTTASPVSAANVDIFLSLDGGYTYPITLATGVPNNGSASVLVPSGSTTSSARVMVRGAGNIFYALNSTNFSITASEFVMNFGPTANTSDVCAPGTATYNFTYNTFLGFNQVTTFSATGNPGGTTVTFSPTTAQTDGTPVTITVSGITTGMVGNHPITVTGTAPAPLVVKNSTIGLNVFSATFNPIALSSPANAATGVVAPYNFSWVADANATTYDIDIATDAGFATIVENATGLTATSYAATTLVSATTYYWRIKPANQCGAGSFSTAYSFTTGTCNTYASTNVPVSISASGTPTITSTLNIATSGTINDVNVVGLIGNHTWINDLTITLTSPQSTTVTLFDGICDSENDFDVNFDDVAPAGALPCPPVGGGNYQPQTVLSAFNGENAAGVWTLTVADGANQDGGALTGWGLEICLDPIVTSINQQELDNAISIYPNPTNSTVTVELLTTDNVENIVLVDVQGKIIYQNNNVSQTSIKIDLRDHSEGIYILKVQYTDAVKTHKIIKQ